MGLAKTNLKCLGTSNRGPWKKDGIWSLRFGNKRYRQGERVGMMPICVFTYFPHWKLFIFPRNKQTSIGQAPTRVQWKYISFFQYVELVFLREQSVHTASWQKRKFIPTFLSEQILRTTSTWIVRNNQNHSKLASPFSKIQCPVLLFSFNVHLMFLQNMKSQD